MRYKNNVLDKLNNTDIIANKIQIQLNRGTNAQEIFDSVETLKESIEKIREIISIEPDDFEQQFAPK